jgi:hypothetical protein
MSSSSKTSTGLRSDPVQQRSREDPVEPWQTSTRFRTLQKRVFANFSQSNTSTLFSKATGKYTVGKNLSPVFCRTITPA